VLLKLCCFFFFFNTRVWTQGFMLARQVLYCLSHSSSPRISFLLFLLLCNSCTSGFIVTFPYMHTMCPGLVHPLHYSPSSPSPSSNDFTRFQCVENTSTIFTLFTIFIYPLPSTSTLSLTWLVLQSCSLSSKYLFIVQWVFALVTCNYIVL
jgi:hypothetical protein